MRLDDALVRSRLDPPSGGWSVREDLRQAAVLLLLVERGGVDHLLFQQRPDTLPQHPGQVAFPGGARDDSEEALDCALRETEEEVGVPRERVLPLGRLRERISIAGYLVAPFVGRLTAATEYTVQAAEVVDVFEIPVAALLEEERWSVRPNRRPLAEVRQVPFFDWDDRIVWGLTAIILRDFMRAVLGRAPLGRARHPETGDHEPARKDTRSRPDLPH